MLPFRNDYASGAHPAVLEALCRTNRERTPGYGQDPYCRAAAAEILRLCRCPQGEVHFFTGGTQVNRAAISALLRPWEAAAAPESAHILVHEAAAIEAAGHRILPCPAPAGKLTPEALEDAYAACAPEHMPALRLACIANATELGTVYTQGELEALRQTADRLDLLLYCDGARLGPAIAAGGADLASHAALCDAFTIGGTKLGLLFGEALVLPRPALLPAFRRCMKQQGAVLAKGRLLGAQFSALLADGLLLSLASRANALASRLAAGLEALGVPLLAPAESNQLFPILPDGAAAALAREAEFEIQCRLDGGRTCIRLVTAWDTEETDVDALLALLRQILEAGTPRPPHPATTTKELSV